MNTSIALNGTGAAYLRVSTDKQDTERQVQSVRSFQERHKVKIAERYWFEDHGWSRDADQVRPEFQRLLQAAERGEIKWIVVDALDRFGAKNSKRLFAYLSRLEDVGCKLYDVSGKEWTGDDDGTEIQAWVGGRTSTREQKEKSNRSLGGMVDAAKRGEWMGGPPKLGFDVACFSREAGKELWRVVWEGREKVGTVERKGKERPAYRVLRRKMYPDGSTERLDGAVVFRTCKDTQVMRIVPTRDTTKLDAAKRVFARYATESVTFFDLAKWLNKLGIRNSFGGQFQSNDTRKMLTDEAYLGYPTFRKRRTGRFKRFDAEGGIVDLEPELKGKDTASAPEDMIRSTTRLFEPLVDRRTWDAVQKKLQGREKKTHAPKNAELYFAGLVVCAGCGAPMIARTDRMEYHCSTRDKHRMRGSLDECRCERNGVSQELLEEYVTRYLDETGKRLELLTRTAGGKHLTSRLETQETEAWSGFVAGIQRLTAYLAKHHPEEYGAIVSEHADDYTLTPNDFVAAVVECYRTNFDPGAVGTEVGRLEAEHTRLMEEWRDLPTPRAKEKAKGQLAELEKRIEELERQREDAGEVVTAFHRQVSDLQDAIATTRIAMKSAAGEEALRRKAQAIRGLLCKIECEFVVTSKGGNGGPGKARSRLVAITFAPIAGDGKTYEVDYTPESNGRYRYHANP